MRKFEQWRTLSILVGLLTLAVVLSACGGGGGEQSGGGGGSSDQITVQGSSTVLPISQAAAEAFKQENSDVELTVGGGGTGDGFEAFCGGNAQIADDTRGGSVLVRSLAGEARDREA